MSDSRFENWFAKLKAQQEATITCPVCKKLFEHVRTEDIDNSDYDYTKPLKLFRVVYACVLSPSLNLTVCRDCYEKETGDFQYSNTKD